MSEDFKFQISVKIADALLNVRAATPEEFDANLRFVDKNASQVLAFCNTFKALPPAQPLSGGGFSSPAPSTPTGPAAGSFSPPARAVKIVSVEDNEGETNGKAWGLTKIKLSDGRSASAFDPLLRSVIKTLYAEGASCVVTTKPSKNPKYLDVEAV